MTAHLRSHHCGALCRTWCVWACTVCSACPSHFDGSWRWLRQTKADAPSTGAAIQPSTQHSAANASAHRDTTTCTGFAAALGAAELSADGTEVHLRHSRRGDTTTTGMALSGAPVLDARPCVAADRQSHRTTLYVVSHLPIASDRHVHLVV